jgi:hypothetical protein
LITQAYNREYPTLNGAWAAARLHGYIPDRILLFAEYPDLQATRRLETVLAAFQESLGKAANVECRRIDRRDPRGFRENLRAVIRDLRSRGANVAVDVTAGRTLSKLALLEACARERPDHVFYLDVDRFDYRDDLFLRVPFRIQDCRDLIAEGSQDA